MNRSIFATVVTEFANRRRKILAHCCSECARRIVILKVRRRVDIPFVHPKALPETYRKNLHVKIRNIKRAKQIKINFLSNGTTRHIVRLSNLRLN